MTVRFFYPTAAGYRKTRIRNRPMLLVLLHSVYVSLSKISIIARTKTRPLEKKGRSLVCGCKGTNFYNTHQIFLQLFSFTRILFLKYLQWHIHYYYIIELAFFKEITYQLSYSVFRKNRHQQCHHHARWKLEAVLLHAHLVQKKYTRYVLKIHTVCIFSTHGVYEMCTYCFFYCRIRGIWIIVRWHYCE